MREKLLLALVGGIFAASAAFADSGNISLAGRVIMGVDNYKLSQGNATTARTYANEYRVDDQGSVLTVNGTEDLGGGLKARFLLTLPFQPDLGGITATGNSWIGLEGGFGRIELGRDSIHYIEFVPIELTRAGSLQDFISMGLGSQVNGISSYLFVPTRTANIIAWMSPNFGGVTATVAYSPAVIANEGSGASAAGNGSKGYGEHFAVRYVTANPLMGGISYWKSTLEQNVQPPPTAFNNDEKSTRAWVGYRFPFGLRVGLAYDNSEVKPAEELAAFGGTATSQNTLGFEKRTAYMVPITYTVGSHAFYFEYAVAGKASGQVQSQGFQGNPALTTNDDTGAKQYLIGWDVALSRRTFFAVDYTKLNNQKNAVYSLFNTGLLVAANSASATQPARGESESQIWVGIAHSF